MHTDCLTDAQFRLLATLKAMANEGPAAQPTNRAIAERCGWLCNGTGKPNTSKVKTNLAALAAKGLLARNLQDDGRHVRRIGITLYGIDGNLAFEAPKPDDHWIAQVRHEVMTLLSAVASEGTAILPERLYRVAGMVQAELAGQHVGGPSALFCKLVEAVSHGYGLAVIDEAITGAGQGRCPRCRIDIRPAFYHLAPVPRDWLQSRGMTMYPPRSASRIGGWYEDAR